MKDIPKKVHSIHDLVQLSRRLLLSGKEAMAALEKSINHSQVDVERSSLRMLRKWSHEGGTRVQLLPVLFALGLMDAARKVENGKLPRRVIFIILSKRNRVNNSLHLLS